jgi:hypothetical protein
MSQLTESLKKYGFFCGIELEVYVLDTGNFTSLVIEGTKQQGRYPYLYDFYKQTFYPFRQNKITVYGEKLTPAQLLQRVERYFTNRKKYTDKRRTK